MDKIPIDSIICGDCLNVMRDWPDGCVDLVLTDPPYGIGVDSTMHKQSDTQYGKAAAPKRAYPKTDWDSKPMTPRQRDECIRLGHNQLFFGGNYFELPPSSCWIVWDKDNGNNNFADCELIWGSFDSAVRLVKYTWNGMIQENMGNKEARYHPTQKPLGVMKWILERYSQPSDLIFDPFCGSGTTCVAAKMLGRNYIGIDISEEYCQIARDRIKAVETGVPVKEQRKGQRGLFEK